MTLPRARGAATHYGVSCCVSRSSAGPSPNHRPGQTPPECRSTALAPARRGAVRRLPTGLLTPSSRPALPRHRAARGLSGSDPRPPPHCAGSTHAGVHSHSAHHRPRGQSRPCAPGRGSPSHHPSGQPLSPRPPSTRARSPSNARPAHPCSRSPAAANDPSMRTRDCSSHFAASCDRPSALHRVPSPSRFDLACSLRLNAPEIVWVTDSTRKRGTTTAN